MRSSSRTHGLGVVRGQSSADPRTLRTAGPGDAQIRPGRLHLLRETDGFVATQVIQCDMQPLFLGMVLRSASRWEHLPSLFSKGR